MGRARDPRGIHGSSSLAAGPLGSRRTELKGRALLALGLALAVLGGLPEAALAIDLSRLYGHAAVKRNSGESCHPYKPFKCPEDNTCISIQYLCDGAPDCREGYDEDPRLCTAAKRPPVEETASFLQALLASHGPNYLEKLFGSKARDALEPLGGVNKVAIALSESQTIEDFGAALHLMRSDLEHLRSVFMAVENGDLGLLKSLGIKDSELGDVKFFLEKLVDTGFLD
ncbi:IDLSRF-like peptide [Copidosoma floridanum]|uniref:IDLSRF-like peptide n=1 Tax=Copidosoma floridanum TaxID=29053 RepID=UPI0006C9438F|nr:IDLSRF-like peptide [Copidosoma floridanum]